jgi:hypothetical protein
MPENLCDIWLSLPVKLTHRSLLKALAQSRYILLSKPSLVLFLDELFQFKFLVREAIVPLAKL